MRVGSATKSEYGVLLEFRCAAEGGAELAGFQLSKINFAQTLEYLRDGKAGGFFNAIVEIHKESGHAGNRAKEAYLSREKGAKGKNLSRASRFELYHCK